MQLHPKTIEALEHKADVAGDTYDENDAETHGWKDTEAECRKAAAEGTTESLRPLKLAVDELFNYVGGSMPKAEETAILRDLCRVGFFEVHDAEGVANGSVQFLGTRPRTLMVDGSLFEV